MRLGTSYKLATVLSTLLALGGAFSTGAAGPSPSADGWVTYYDPLYDVTLKHPADWQVVPHGGRDDLGGVITFTQPRPIEDGIEPDPHHGPRKIVFGPYLTARENGIDAASWRLLRDEHFAPYRRNVGSFHGSERITVAGHDALRTFEDTPLGPSRSTDIPRGKIMWFLWDDGDAEQTPVYERMLASLRFAKRTPGSLQELYGADFRAASVLAPETSGNTLAQRSLSSYRVPLRYTHTAKCSDTHGSDQTEYAIDVFIDKYNSVYAAESGEVLHADWWGNYGKLLKMKSGNYEHFYGHLSAYYWYIWVGNTISRGELVAFTGDTGLGDAHLHFEIRNRNTNHGVDMSAVNGFSPNSSYPGQNGVAVTNCGTWSY